MRSSLLALLIFYRTHAAASVLISLGCGFILYSNGLGPLPFLLILKLVSALVILYFIEEFRSESYYFYHNLGLTKRGIWIGSLSLDLLLFALISTVSILVRS